MKWIIKAIGFAIFAVVTQYLSWISHIDVLEDLTIFTIPGLKVMLPIGIAAWCLLDGISLLARSKRRRRIIFWSMWLVLAVATVVAPPLMSKDGLAIGLMWVLFGSWISTVALYALVVLAVEVIQARKRMANHTSDGIRRPADGSPKPSM